MQSNTYDGKVWGVPWYTDAGLIYYRKDLLQQSGFSAPPKTWDELKAMTLKTTQASGTKYGFVFQGADYEGGVCDGLEYIWTHGGDVLDPNDPSKVIIHSPESASGLQTWRSMITDDVAPQAVLTCQEDQTNAAFLPGNAIVARNWPYVYALLSDPKASKIKPAQVGVAPIPVSDGNQSYSCLGGWNFYINASSDKQDEVWDFIKWITTPEQEKFNALGGGKLPPCWSLYEDQEVLQKVPVARLGKEAIIGNTRPRPVSPYYSDMSLKLS